MDRFGEFLSLVEGLGACEYVYNQQGARGEDAVYVEVLSRISNLSEDITTIEEKIQALNEDKQHSNVGSSENIKEGIKHIGQQLMQFQALHTNCSYENVYIEEHFSLVFRSLHSKFSNVTTSLTDVLGKELEVSSKKEIAGKYNIAFKDSNRLHYRETDYNSYLEAENGTEYMTVDMGHVGGVSKYMDTTNVLGTQSEMQDSRNAALESMERAISEIGAVFQQLSYMVSMQGETVQRLDFDIEEAQINIEQGHLQILNYWKSIESNKSLLLKGFVVILALFILFVLLFS